MSIKEKTAYLRGLADGLGIDPQSKEGKLWTALNDVLGDIANELEALRETDLSQAEALDKLGDEVSMLEDICDGTDEYKFSDEDDDEDEDEELEYDGVIYDATCPVCGEEISFDEETLELGSIKCPNCGENLEFDLGEEEETPEGKDEEDRP